MGMCGIDQAILSHKKSAVGVFQEAVGRCVSGEPSLGVFWGGVKRRYEAN